MQTVHGLVGDGNDLRWLTPRGTRQNRPLVDGSKPATTVEPRPIDVYRVTSCWRKSARALVRQLRGPHLRMCPW
jgi:hypothetical protein